MPIASSGRGIWASATNPITAAVAGSKASSKAKRAWPTLRSTTWSSAYGSTLDSTPTPTASSSNRGAPQTGPLPRASGEHSTVAMANPTAISSNPLPPCANRLPSTM